MVVHDKVEKLMVASLMLRLGDLGLLQSFVPIQLPQFTKAEIYIGGPSCLSTYIIDFLGMDCMFFTLNRAKTAIIR